MKRPWLAIALVLSVGINIGILVTTGLSRGRGDDSRSERRSADHEHQVPRGSEREGSRVERLAERIGLAGPAREQFIDGQAHFFEAYQRIRQDMMVARQSLRAEIAAATPDRDRIEEQLAETARLTAELNRAFVDNVQATRELLTDEQESAYLAMLERLREHGEGRWSRGEGPHRSRGQRDRPPGG